MVELPVFALPETVVFPGMTIPLYVFEERYKKLVKDCVDHNQRRFIIVLSKPRTRLSDSEATTHEVGSFVDILSVSENPDGTFNLLVHGQERCRVEIVARSAVRELDGSARELPYSRDKPYPLERLDPNLERVTAWDCLDTFRAYAKTFFALNAVKQIEEALPDDLVYQASFVCANLRVPASARQTMLEAPSLVARFQTAQKLMHERLTAREAN